MCPIISVGAFPRKGIIESKIINIVKLCEHSAQGFPVALRILWRKMLSSTSMTVLGCFHPIF